MLKQSSVLLLQGSILAISAIIFAQCLSFSFVNWDDNAFLGTPLVRQFPFSNLFEIFKTHVTGRYYPLTILAFQIQHYFFHFEPLYYHAVNIVLHLINVTLVFKILENLRLDKKISALTAFLFAIHPLQVETVAWVSSFKDLLLSFLFLWSILIYTRASRRRVHQYYLLVLYFLALSAKITAISLPLLFLLFDYCAKKRIYISDWKEKIPFFILAVFFAALNLTAVHSANVFSMSFILPWVDGLWLSGYALWLYVLKIIFPFSLCNYYPLPAQTQGFFPLKIYFLSLLFIFLSLLALRKLSHELRVAFLAFIIMISPCLHILKINNCLIYERFVYLPDLGIFFIMSSFMCSLLTKIQGEKTKYMVSIITHISFIPHNQLLGTAHGLG